MKPRISKAMRCICLVGKAFALFLIGWSAVFAADFVLKPLVSGENNIDLDGDGIVDKIFVAWVENFNANSSEQITFYRRTTSAEHPWALVPFFDARGEHIADYKRTHLGADCQVRTISLVATDSKKSPFALMIADRDLNKTYISAEPVTFILFELERNEEGIPGWPEVYWKQTKKIQSTRNYCDVREATRAEYKRLFK